MKGYLSIREASYKWGISERRVNQYVAQGRIPGAERFGRSWAIPDDAVKPTDPRKQTPPILFYNRYRNSTATMVPVLPANAGYPAVFFVCGHLTGQARERKVIENGDAVTIYSYGVLSAAGAYK